MTKPPINGTTALVLGGQRRNSMSSPPSPKKQIYIPANQCHTREREYARARLGAGFGGQNGNPPIFTLNNNNSTQIPPQFNDPTMAYNFTPNFQNEEEDFWEDLSVNKSNVLRRMSAVDGVIGPSPTTRKGPVVGKAEQQRMLRDVVAKLRQNVDKAARNVGILPNKQARAEAKVSRGTSASSRVGVMKKGGGEWAEEEEKGGKKQHQNEEGEEYGIGAKLAAEFSGDLFLVLISSLSALGLNETNGRLQAGLSTGLTIFVLVASIGQISGGHFNPAVSFAMALAGKVSIAQMVLFWMAQLSGGFVGALLVRAVTQQFEYDSIGGGATIFGQNQPWYQGFLGETLLTALLVQTILNGAVERPQNPLAPLAIGCTILVDIVGAGALSGASMNPARSFGPCLAASLFSAKLTDADIWSRHYVYWTGPFAGATISALAFRKIFTRNRH